MYAGCLCHLGTLSHLVPHLSLPHRFETFSWPGRYTAGLFYHPAVPHAAGGGDRTPGGGPPVAGVESAMAAPPAPGAPGLTPCASSFRGRGGAFFDGFSSL